MPKKNDTSRTFGEIFNSATFWPLSGGRTVGEIFLFAIFGLLRGDPTLGDF